MSKRTDSDFARDMEEAIGRISSYSAGLTYEAFLLDTKTQDAIVRNLEIIGEAVRVEVGVDNRREVPIGIIEICRIINDVARKCG